MSAQAVFSSFFGRPEWLSTISAPAMYSAVMLPKASSALERPSTKPAVEMSGRLAHGWNRNRAEDTRLNNLIVTK